MKIVQVLTYLSEDGAYGGPAAVAREQCQALAAEGHEVHLVSGWDGNTSFEAPGVHVHLHRVWRLPVGGFAGYLSPGVWRQVGRLAKSADVIHFHLARDLVQLPATLGLPKGARVVIQAHGMILPDARLSARAMDGLFTRRVYRRAHCHMVLTPREQGAASTVARRAVPTLRLRNGVPVPAIRSRWAEPPRVAFISRLHRRKRPTAFIRAASLSRHLSDAQWLLYGADEGELGAVQAEIQSLGGDPHVEYAGALRPSEVLKRMSEVQVFVLPSVDEPFPMALLEAMSVGLPCVITDSTGISDELRERGAARVTDGTPGEIAAAVSSLLEDRATWEHQSRLARIDIAQHFSPSAVVASLLQAYQARVLPPNRNSAQ